MSPAPLHALLQELMLANPASLSSALSPRLGSSQQQPPAAAHMQYASFEPVRALASGQTLVTAMPLTPCRAGPCHQLLLLSSTLTPMAAGCVQDPNVSSAWHVPSAILAQVQRLLKPGEDEIAQVSQVDSRSRCQLLRVGEPTFLCTKYLLAHKTLASAPTTSNCTIKEAYTALC